MNSSTLAVQDTRPVAGTKPKVVGIYGLPGSGKSYLRRQLEEKLNQDQFCTFEGSDVISSLVDGGLTTFKTLGHSTQTFFRQLAATTIARKCAETARVGIVNGHFMFWDGGGQVGKIVWTDHDAKLFTHILYLDTPCDLVLQQRKNDAERARSDVSQAHLQKWQEKEREWLRSICRDHGILFRLVRVDERSVEAMVPMLLDIREHNELVNRSRVLEKVDKMVQESAFRGELDTFLVIDGDKTLTAVDTSACFWKAWAASPERHETGEESIGHSNPLKSLFSSSLGYSYQAFRQATWLYEETSGEFVDLCRKVAAELSLTMRPEFVTLLTRVAQEKKVGVVVVTSGIGLIWQYMVELRGLDKFVKVLGGGRTEDGMVMDPPSKALVVDRLRETHGMQVWAFGDSPLDVPMLKRAHEAVVVVGDGEARSTTMDAALAPLVDSGELRARQALFPKETAPLLDTTRLPVVDITEASFARSILRRNTDEPGERRPLQGGAAGQIVCASGTAAAKLLMTPMRDARVAGPALREAHRRAGWFLAVNLVSDIVGLEAHATPHVQGHDTDGFRLRDEAQTLIIPLMRGGEAMAFGVNDAFPTAGLLHASRPETIDNEHLRERRTAILVDYVINSGASMVAFLDRLKVLGGVRIVIVAGVVQQQAVSEGGLLHRHLARSRDIHLCMLRTSQNKFAGRGSTDTGNRLFNTTELD